MSVNNFILETASAPGTSTTFNLAGAATGRLSFASRYSSGATPYYFIDDGVQSEWGIGTFNTGTPNTLSRTTVIGNTALNTSRLNFAGTVRVYCDIPAERMVFVGANGAVNLASRALAFDTAGAKTMVWDAAAISGAGAIVMYSNLQVNGTTVYFPNAGLVVGGAIDITGSVTFRAGSTTVGTIASTTLPGSASYANDAAAAAGGVAVGSFYRNGSALMVRVA